MHALSKLPSHVPSSWCRYNMQKALIELVKDMPCLLLCSYKVHKIHKKRIEPSEHVDLMKTPSAANSMQREHREESNVR